MAGLRHGAAPLRRQPLPHRGQRPVHQPGPVPGRGPRAGVDHRGRAESAYQVSLRISPSSRRGPYPLPGRSGRPQGAGHPFLRRVHPPRLPAPTPLRWRAHGPGASALCLVSPPLLDYSHQVMSEIPYLAFSLAALLLLQRAQASRAWSALALATIAAMAAYYVRSAGIVLVGAGAGFLLLHKRWREAGLMAAGSFLLALPWHLRNAAHGGSPYIDQLLSINPYRPWLGPLTLPALVERIAANLELYGLYIVPDILLPGLAGGNPFIGLASSGLVLYALVAGLARRQLPAVKSEQVTPARRSHREEAATWPLRRFPAPFRGPRNESDPPAPDGRRHRDRTARRPRRRRPPRAVHARRSGALPARRGAAPHPGAGRRGAGRRGAERRRESTGCAPPSNSARASRAVPSTAARC